MVIAYRFQQDGSMLYVAQRPGEGGKDWGYTKHPEGVNGLDKAQPLSAYWWKRFAADMRRCNTVAFCVPA
jgi:hypothetical protein